jgi:hypothetical protein
MELDGDRYNEIFPRNWKKGETPARFSNSTQALTPFAAEPL